ncbi:MAG: glycosyltransferase [Lachnospiraceae bacterium]|nr:glycosyltransferase [Lachnospiraceae bacterium]
MKLVWLVNSILPQIAAAQGHEGGVIGGWTVQLADYLSQREDISFTVFYPQQSTRDLIRGRTGNIQYVGFYEEAAPELLYNYGMEEVFRQELEGIQPDLVHIWGTEFVHSLCMVRAFDNPDRTVISLQGLMNPYSKAYLAELPQSVISRHTFRDRLRKDSILEQQRKFRIRGRFERVALRLVHHVIGRTDWDRNEVLRMNPNLKYHHCREILRREFYWIPENTEKDGLLSADSAGKSAIDGLVQKPPEHLLSADSARKSAIDGLVQKPPEHLLSADCTGESLNDGTAQKSRKDLQSEGYDSESAGAKEGEDGLVWRLDACQRHSIFLTQSYYPIKGMHFALRGLRLIKRKYPDALLYVSGVDIIPRSLKGRLKQGSYSLYIEELIERLDLQDSVIFVGEKAAQDMVRQYLSANVFLMASSIENSPNSLGEAMILGLPCVASRVGGIPSMLMDEKEGFLYNYNKPAEMAKRIIEIFEMPDQELCRMTERARVHAADSYSRSLGLNDYLRTYGDILGEDIIN